MQCTADVKSAVEAVTRLLGPLAPDVEFGVLQQRLRRFEGALVVGVIADHQLVEH